MRVDNFPDEYENPAYWNYQENFPQRFALVRAILRRPRLLLFVIPWVALVFVGTVIWFSTPLDPRVVIVVPPTPTIGTGLISGDFPADAQQIITSLPARIDNSLTSGARHGYRFPMLQGEQWEIDLFATTFDPTISLYSAEGILVAQNDDVNFDTGNLNSSIIFNVETSGQYALLVESAKGTFNAGEYSLTIMPVR